MIRDIKKGKAMLASVTNQEYQNDPYILQRMIEENKKMLLVERKKVKLMDVTPRKTASPLEYPWKTQAEFDDWHAKVMRDYESGKKFYSWEEIETEWDEMMK